MPKISLRLSDEQLEQLRIWAESSERSMQREIIYRLFAEQTALAERGGSHAETGALGREAPASAAPRSPSAAPAEPSFSPDFGAKLKKT